MESVAIGHRGLPLGRCPIESEASQSTAIIRDKGTSQHRPWPCASSKLPPLHRTLPKAQTRGVLPPNQLKSFLPHPPDTPHLRSRPPKTRRKQHGQAPLCSASIETNKPFPNRTSPAKAKAAFFDVDGTIAKTNIVWPYVYLRLRELSLLARLFWVPYFSALSLLYRLADKIDRGLLCRFFYFNYRGRLAARAQEWGRYAYKEYMRPRLFQGAVQRIRDLKAAGFRIVLVTGSLSFMVAPLAAEVQADDVIAADLVERDGRFTGELASTAFNGTDKQAIVKEYAAQHGIDLERSHAYGDSIADLGMLESVGHPHAVLPDKQLRWVAEQRKWPSITEWALEEKPPHPLSRLWV